MGGARIIVLACARCVSARSVRLELRDTATGCTGEKKILCCGYVAKKMIPSFSSVAGCSKQVEKQHTNKRQSASPKSVKITTSPRVKIYTSCMGQLIPWIRLCNVGQARLLCRLTIGLLVHSLTSCIGIIISSQCSAQMFSEQAGDYSSSSKE